MLSDKHIGGAAGTRLHQSETFGEQPAHCFNEDELQVTVEQPRTGADVVSKLIHEVEPVGIEVVLRYQRQSRTIK